ncbi:hypothetical protein [Caenispirillum salinarum]|uniref:hypothetical protein n=1 Tax=Caenispirillum salinarum TaxID=859058 RepID=UPI00384AEED4
MRLLRRRVAAAGVLLVAAMPVAAQEAGGGESDSRAQALVEDLRRAVVQAERSGAATPAFIKELRALIARYDAPYAQLVVRDTFQDGAYRSDPRWVVVSGQWQAVAGSVVSPPTGPALAPPDRPPDDAERLQEQLGAVTRLVERLRGRAASGNGEGDGPPPTIPPPAPHGGGAKGAAPALLALPVHVPPIFRLTARVTLEDDPERHDAGLSVRDGAGETGYRVRLGSFASRSRVELERLTDRGPRTLGSEVLDDSLAGGPVHSIALERNQDGRLIVRVNGVAVVSVEERREPARLEHVMLERMAGRLIVSQVEVWTAVP